MALRRARRGASMFVVFSQVDFVYNVAWCPVVACPSLSSNAWATLNMVSESLNGYSEITSIGYLPFRRLSVSSFRSSQSKSSQPKPSKLMRLMCWKPFTTHVQSKSEYGQIPSPTVIWRVLAHCRIPSYFRPSAICLSAVASLPWSRDEKYMNTIPWIARMSAAWKSWKTLRLAHSVVRLGQPVAFMLNGREV